MKIQLPDGKRIDLDENISLDEKIKVVEDLTEEFMPTIIENWHSNSVRFFLDGLSNYLVWHKENRDKNKEDKEILSIKKVEQMEGKRKSMSIPFTSLSQPQREALGLDGDSK